MNAGAVHPVWPIFGGAAVSDRSTHLAMPDVSVDLRKYSSDELVPSLKRLLCSSESLSSVASRSYVHANGFYKIVLAEHEQRKLRLHVWLPGVNAEENVHEHRWFFCSTVVTGVLHSESYVEDVTRAAKSFDEWLYLAKSGFSPPSKSLIGQTMLTRDKSTVRRAGEHYWMAPTTMHRIVRTDEKLTSTLMLQSAPARRSNRLLTIPGKPADVEQRYISSDETGSVIESLLTAFSKH